ncbi:hypothetical protein TVAG_280900 [Trichomonas vaginalis G3]|uniref:Uncharacterized protein n=1 Tax=Trichomonas vaginalis (strain ATCC PRA-98 / G3) TaxID=412133 RepID=A2DRL0_TRIV3|nr:hypothetical protein TVAGG3_0696830 [Trichomonas vaginalis G3]EAY16973.1 hypothetical protein TVAG_280900 [Trichomonas vaginalis G3]KAI5508980.1 hypothetical protein TVAGG3_0696830 [Trichomonas vaginalis G3]|eukprot:XP_001329196.1 hypothetical protein [Trichomonas vaginalis G3]
MQNDWIYSNSPKTGTNEGTYLVKHKNFKISWNDHGIGLYLRVDDNTEIKGSSGRVTNGDVSISVSYKLFPDVNYINIIHTVTNNGDRNHEIDFRCFSDIDIPGSDGSRGDQCPERNIEGNRGVEFINKDRTVRFLLRDFPFVTNVDTYSYSRCPGVGPWSNCTEYKYIESGAYIYFSWQNQQIKPHESKKYSYSIGMGEYYAKIEPKQTETIDDNENITQFLYCYHIFLNCIVFIVVLK